MTTTTALAATSFRLPRVLGAIVASGTVAGLVDIGSASVIYGAAPDRVMRAIARGLIGDAAVHGGAPAALLGALLQVFIAIGAATVYVTAASRLPVLFRRPVLCGLPFGAGVFCVMRFIVVPLSLAPSKLAFSPSLVFDFAANCMFGAIIAVIASRMLRAATR